MKNLRQKVSSALLVACVTIATPVFAALPTEADTVVTAVTTDGTAAIGKGWVVMATILAGMIALGVFRKAVSKGAGG